MGIRALVKLMLGAGVALALAGGAGASSVATVNIDFLPDGRCAVSAEGEGFHSNLTYMPEGVHQPDELRCAMPPVPGGRTVTLTVLLTPGTARPRSTVPRLQWVRAGDRWTGTASLNEWPEAVVVSTVSPLPVAWISVAAVAVILLAAAIRRGLAASGA